MATFTTLPTEIKQKIFNYKTKMEYDDRWGWSDAIVSGAASANANIPRLTRYRSGEDKGVKDMWKAINIHTKQYGETPSDHIGIRNGVEMSWMDWKRQIINEIWDFVDPDPEDYEYCSYVDVWEIIPSKVKIEALRRSLYRLG